MYARRPPTARKPRTSQLKKFAAPVAGWIANRALADPASIDGPGAAVLDNFFPKATTVVLRRGNQRYATFEDVEIPVLSLFAYRNGLNERLFGANETTIYDLTSVPFPMAAIIVTDEDDDIVTEDGDTIGWGSTEGLDVGTGYTSGYWSTAQFATTGGVYLIGVNGQDTGFIFDGENFFPYIDGGIHRLNYDAEVSAFTEGETVTGSTSGATATIERAFSDGAGAGYLWLSSLTGNFVNDETIMSAGGEAAADGTETLAAPGVTFANGRTTADMSFVWVYGNRLWFVEKESLNAWFMTDVDAIGGGMDYFPFGGIFPSGGSLLFGSPWSLDSSGDAGLSEQCIFVSSLGEVAVYQGSDPQEAESWRKVGLYRVGKPLGPRAFIRGGGDIAIATTVGLVPLSKAISLDVTALSVATLSYKIADAWSEALRLRGDENWICELWPDSKMAFVAPPEIIGGGEPTAFVSNTETGAWCRFSGWTAFCTEVFRGELYFGSVNGGVFKANIGGTDDDHVYSGTVLPLFDDMGAPGSAKIGTMARAVVRSSNPVNGTVSMQVNFDTELPAAPDAAPIEAGSIWGEGIWGDSIWGSKTPTLLTQDWQSVGGIGTAVSPGYQVSSGAASASDAELIEIEMLYHVAEVIT